jgi:CBS domain containing-hemolysin-like protein
VTALDLGLLAVLAGLISFLFVLAMVEAALLHVRRSEVAAAAVDGDRGSHRLLCLLDELPEVMNTVLLAVLLVQVSSTAIAGVLAQRWFGGTGVTIATVAVTVVLFIYGEAIPKTIAIAHPARHARRFGRLIRVLRALLGPVVSVLVRIAKWQYRGDVAAVSAVSEGELLHLTGEAAAAGRIDPSDAELIEKSFTLGDLRVGDIAIRLADVVSVSTSTPAASALRTAIDAGHRRIVVHDGSPDRIVGFVRLRDLADSRSIGDDAITRSSVREALFVARSALVIDVLREMQRTRCHLAVVTGADAVAVGIVTIEDIIEELLGEIDEPGPRE